MQFYIPPHRAKAVCWREYVERQELERLEMAKRIMTWYSDLETEVAQHFKKALEGPRPAKRLRLDDQQTLNSPKRATTSAGSDSSCSFTRPSETSSSTASVPSIPLPSLFPPPPPAPVGVPPPTIIYPDYYHYTSEVDPVLNDHLSDYDSDEDDDDNESDSSPPAPTKSEKSCDTAVYPTVSHAHFPDDHTHRSVCPGRVEAWLSSHCPLGVYSDKTSDYGSLPPLSSSISDHSLIPTTSSCLHNMESLKHNQSCCDGDHTSLPLNTSASTSYRLSHSSSSLSPPDPSSEESNSLLYSPTVSLDFAVVSSDAGDNDDVVSSEDDIIDNIQLDWTEEEKRELRTIIV